MRTSVFLIILSVGVASADDKAKPPSPTEVTARLEAIASKSAKTKSDVPRFAFTSNVTIQAPASLDEATVGLPEIALADKSKTLLSFADGDTAWLSTHLGEYQYCAKPGCPKQAPDSWL